MTNLENLKKLLAAGTKGPWAVLRNFSGSFEIALEDGSDYTNWQTLVRGLSESDASLIVAAVNSLPDLIKELTALREFVEEVKGMDARKKFEEADTVAQVDAQWRSLIDTALANLDGM